MRRVSSVSWRWLNGWVQYALPVSLAHVCPTREDVLLMRLKKSPWAQNPAENQENQQRTVCRGQSPGLAARIETCRLIASQNHGVSAPAIRYHIRLVNNYRPKLSDYEPS